MAALQLVGIEELFPRSGGYAASRSSRRAACRASLPAFTLNALMPVPACKQSLHAFKPARGMPRKLAGFHPP